jgi:hypothetical protein
VDKAIFFSSGNITIDRTNGSLSFFGERLTALRAGG